MYRELPVIGDLSPEDVQRAAAYTSEFGVCIMA